MMEADELKSRTLARKIADFALTKKAQDVVIMDLRPLTSMTDFFVVCSAESDIQIRAIADAVEDGLEKKQTVAWHKEAGSLNWVLLDYVDVVLHVFHKHARSFYNLERLWGDAEVEHVLDEPTAKRSGKRKASVIRASRVRKKFAS